jgi:DNA-binding GntR family transcriptional regulator
MEIDASPYHFLEPLATPSRGNVTAFVTDLLRQSIVTLQLKPGEVIDKTALCDRLGVSRFPVSEALARLQAEGLVDILPQRGTTISLVRIADVLEYMLIRKALEAEAVRVVTTQRSTDLIEALARNLSYQRAAAGIDDHFGFHERDIEFHDIIFADMRFTRVKGVIEHTRGNLDRARRLLLSPRRLGTSLTEHEAIYAGIERGDPVEAERAMRAHIDSVMAEVITLAHKDPGLFADGDILQRDPGYTAFPFG